MAKRDRFAIHSKNVSRYAAGLLSYITGDLCQSVEGSNRHKNYISRIDPSGKEVGDVQKEEKEALAQYARYDVSIAERH